MTGDYGDNRPAAAAHYPIALPGRPRFGQSLAPFVRLLPVAAVLALAPLAMRSDGGRRALLASSAFVALFSMRATGAFPLCALAYLAFLGGIRRYLIPVLGWSGNDLLLLVCPAVAGLIFGGKAFARQLPRDTRLARLLPWLLLIMALQIFNPMQGGLEVGAAGALFYIVPLLWYYVGRDLGTAEFLPKLLRLTVGIAILAALYGLYQNFFGFAPCEETWIQLAGPLYGALNVGDTKRVFSFFTSAAEYNAFLSLGIVLLWAYWLRTRSFAALLPIPLLAAAILYSGIRGPIVFTLFTCALLVAVQGRRAASWLPRCCLALAVGAVGLIWSLQQVEKVNGGGQAQELVAHQTQGLLNPFDSEKSTVGIHTDLIGIGFMEGFTNPLGRGLGATTLAASKYGEGSVSTEVDLSNMFLSLGLAGGLLYAALCGLILTNAFRYWHRARSVVALSLLGVLAASLGQWLNGGHYAACLLIWFCIGALDRAQAEEAQ
ncbi:MAG TPA: hypothetical protein VFB38_12335 [Chthonomonadaceae bacterium]|nr:hypothetical protein [Chthonomonadaceae bacterium]